MKQVVDPSEFGEKLSTALDSQDRKTLEKRLQVRRNRTGYEAVISSPSPFSGHGMTMSPQRSARQWCWHKNH